MKKMPRMGPAWSLLEKKKLASGPGPKTIAVVWVSTAPRARLDSRAVQGDAANGRAI